MNNNEKAVHNGLSFLYAKGGKVWAKKNFT